MAVYPEDGIIFLSLDSEYRHFLGAIRHWQHLKMGSEENLLWVKGLTAEEAQSPEVRTIPYKTLFTTREGKLFPLGSLLPQRDIPACLWTPIERMLPLSLPSLNHNFFGVEDRVRVEIIPSQNEEPPVALCTRLSLLATYMETASAIRLQHLQWTVLNDSQALMIGMPLLPLPGTVYWRRNDLLLPAGHDLALPLLSQTISQAWNSEGAAWILAGEDGLFRTLPKNVFSSLSRSSFRATIKILS